MGAYNMNLSTTGWNNFVQAQPIDPLSFQVAPLAEQQEYGSVARIFSRRAGERIPSDSQETTRLSFR